MEEMDGGLEFFFEQVDTRMVPRECTGKVLQEDKIEECELISMK